MSKPFALEDWLGLLVLFCAAIVVLKEYEEKPK